MRELKTAVAALTCALVACAATANANPTRRPARLTKPSGGLVEKPYAGKALHVVDAQSGLAPEQVASAAESVRWLSRLPLVVSRSVAAGNAAAWKMAQGLASRADVGAVVLVVDDADAPFLVASPDGRWSVLNVAALLEDSARVQARLSKLVWSATSLALGAGVPAPFSSLAELDALPSEPGPAAHNALVDAARMRGFGFVTLATYRTACEEGWAPAPTNEVQRAIWEKVHALPTEPIRIRPETRKVAE